MVLAKVARPTSVILLLGDGGTNALLGCVHLEADGDSCELGMLAIDATNQASGLGKLLVSRAETWAMEHWHATIMRMHVISVRTELLAWYDRRGYTRTGERLPFAGPAASLSRPTQGSLFFETLEKRLRVL